jgi:histidinol-phosphate phosphatase family protein
MKKNNLNMSIFLDRDGTLNKDPKGYVHKVEDFELYPGVIDALKLLKNYKLFIISNQSGIGRGYYTIEDYQKFNNHLLSVLRKDGIKIEETYFCPNRPETNCDCRKPNTKFIMQAKKKYDLDLSKSFVIGDHPSDTIMGHNAGCKSIYLLTGHGTKHKAELTKSDYVANDLLDAAKWISSQK